MADGIRLAEKRDIPALCTIWKSSFSDEEDYIKLFYKENFEHIETFVYEVNNTPISMVHAMDCCFAAGEEQIAAKLLYAGCTLPENRRNGCFTELMKYVIKEESQRGYALFLKPSDSDHISYYERLGFKPDSYLRLITIIPSKIKPVSAAPLSPAEYNRMRNFAFSHLPYAKWSDRHLKWCVEENEYFSGKTFSVKLNGEEYFIMAAPENNALIITETNLSVKQLKQLSGALCDMFGTEHLKAYMPEFACDEGEKIITSLVYNAPLKNTYVNLILI